MRLSITGDLIGGLDFVPTSIYMDITSLGQTAQNLVALLY